MMLEEVKRREGATDAEREFSCVKCTDCSRFNKWLEGDAEAELTEVFDVGGSGARQGDCWQRTHPGRPFRNHSYSYSFAIITQVLP